MTKRQDRDAIYAKRQFDTGIIVLCARWYITYRLSYRDLVALTIINFLLGRGRRRNDRSLRTDWERAIA